LDGGLQRLSCGWLAVREKDAFRGRRQSGEPPEKLALSRVSGELSQLDDFRVDRDGSAEDGKGLSAFLKRAAACAFGLKSGENDGVA